MKKQTATEWLFAHLLPFLNDNGFVDPQENEHFFKCLAEAKAMEKEQMIKFCQTWEDGTIEDTKTDLYNAIYGGNNE
jgi:hypothetical protein